MIGWGCYIEKVQNGYMVEYPTQFKIKDEPKTFKIIFEDVNDEPKSTREMLASVAEYFGDMYDGFSSENLNIKHDLVGDEVEDNRELIELELDEDVFLSLFMMAHKQDITFNELVCNILEDLTKKEDVNE